MTWSRIHSAPLRVLPKPRPASSSQVRQSPFGACWLGRPHQPQSCSIASSSRSLVRFRNVASCSGGSDASNSAGETFSDSDNFDGDDLDRLRLDPAFKLACQIVDLGPFADRVGFWLGLAERLTAVIPDGRDQSRVTHLLPDIL